MVKVKQKELKKAMFIKGYNFKDLAKAVGISKTHMSQIYNRKANVNPKLGKKIAEILEEEIFGLFEI